jgi:hypothetical protein
MKTTRLLAILLLAAGPIVACSDDSANDTAGTTTTEASGPPTIDVTAAEAATGDATTYSFDVPDDLTAGAIDLNLANDGAEAHHAQLFQLKDGADPEAVLAKLKADDLGGALAFGAFAGGTGVTDPGSSSAADGVIDLAEGQYAIMCFLPDAQGVPHLVNGMFTTFDVGAATGDSADLPDATEAIEGIDFGFTGDTPSGTGVAQFTNSSTAQAHEANIIKLADGKTVDDALAWDRKSPPPFSTVGGAQAVMPGAAQRISLDLDAGSYVMICQIPDPADGKPHVAKGMFKAFTVP